MHSSRGVVFFIERLRPEANGSAGPRKTRHLDPTYKKPFNRDFVFPFSPFFPFLEKTSPCFSPLKTHVSLMFWTKTWGLLKNPGGPRWLPFGSGHRLRLLNTAAATRCGEASCGVDPNSGGVDLRKTPRKNGKTHLFCPKSLGNIMVFRCFFLEFFFSMKVKR